MSAYAEDAYGKPGYFIVFFLYFLSLAIGNVAIAISAVGYLASFFPWLSVDRGRDHHRRHRTALAHDDRELRRTQRDRKDRLRHGLGCHPAGGPPLLPGMVLVQVRYLLGGLEPATG